MSVFEQMFSGPTLQERLRDTALAHAATLLVLIEKGVVSDEDYQSALARVTSYQEQHQAELREKLLSEATPAEKLIISALENIGHKP